MIGDSPVSIAAEFMSAEIDTNVIMQLLAIGGWTKVDLPLNYYTSEFVKDMQTWVNENTTGESKHNSAGTRWVFELQEDATMFILRWS